MIQTKEDREFEERFLQFKKSAEKKHKNPSEALNPDEIDDGVYYALFYHFLAYKYGVFTEEEYEVRAKNLMAKYKTRKSMRKRQFEMYREAHERAMRCSQIETQLLKGNGLSYKETFNLLFEYIGALRNDCIARGLKRSVGYSLITGCKNFTDEELEQLEKEYSSSKGKEKNKQCLTA